MLFILHPLNRYHVLAFFNALMAFALFTWLTINLNRLTAGIHFHENNISHQGQKFIKRSIDHSRDWINSFKNFGATLLLCMAVLSIQFVTILYLTFCKN